MSVGTVTLGFDVKKLRGDITNLQGRNQRIAKKNCEIVFEVYLLA